jgi:hypothetical protein
VAEANSAAIGTRNGYADSRAVASADLGGHAISNSLADARGCRGGAAIADSESIAAAIGGLAISNSAAIADAAHGGYASSRSTSTALSEFGVALSDSSATSRGRFGGEALSSSDAIADTRGGYSDSRSRVVSDARFHARAEANGIGISRSGWREHRSTNVEAVSRAERGSHSRADAVMIRVR